MKRVTGLGGVFFKARDPEKLYAWYERHLGLKRRRKQGAVVFGWRDAKSGDVGMTLWSLFPNYTEYFEPSHAPFMLNYRVADLRALVKTLRAEGVPVAKVREYPYGCFAWIMDPEGNRIELWEPPKAKPKKRSTKRK